jgi:hypothetical protein
MYVPIPAGLVLTSLARKGTTISLLTKTSKRYEGVIALITDRRYRSTGVTLRDVKEITAPNAPVNSCRYFFITSTDIESWYPLPADFNTSGPLPTMSSNMDNKERSSLLALAGLTVCGINDGHIASAHRMI